MHFHAGNRLYRGALGQKSPLLAQSLDLLGQSFISAGDAARGEPFVREALAIRRNLYGQTNIVVAQSLQLLSAALYRLDKFDEAEAVLGEALAIIKSLEGEQGGSMVDWLGFLSELKEARRDFLSAAALTREAIKIRSRIFGEDDSRMGGLRWTLGKELRLAGRMDEAEQELNRALALNRKVYGDPHALSRTLINLAEILRSRGEFAAAETHAREALQVETRANGREDYRTADLHGFLSDLRFEQQDWAEALSLARNALSIARNSDPVAVPVSEDRLQQRAQEFIGRKEYAQAEAPYRDVLESRRSRRPADHEDLIATIEDFAGLLSEWAWAEAANRVRPTAAAATASSGRQESSNKAANVSAPQAETASSPAERALEAEHLLRDCLAIRLRGTNAAPWRVADVQSRLGGALVALVLSDPSLNSEARLLVKLKEAESLLAPGYDGLQQSPEVEATLKRDAIERFVRLYDAWETAAPNTGKVARRDHWRTVLENLDRPSSAKPSNTPDQAK